MVSSQKLFQFYSRSSLCLWCLLSVCLGALSILQQIFMNPDEPTPKLFTLFQFYSRSSETGSLGLRQRQLRGAPFNSIVDLQCFHQKISVDVEPPLSILQQIFKKLGKRSLERHRQTFNSIVDLLQSSTNLRIFCSSFLSILQQIFTISTL